MTTLGLWGDMGRGGWEGKSFKFSISIKANRSIWQSVPIKANCSHLTQRFKGEVSELWRNRLASGGAADGGRSGGVWQSGYAESRV
jgi:hypothetical protein